jgi:hypothetical protein
VFEHLPKPNETSGEIPRILKPEGNVYRTEYSKSGFLAVWEN